MGKTVEYKCRKCGQVFIDDESDNIHYIQTDDQGNLIDDCDGIGNPIRSW